MSTLPKHEVDLVSSGSLRILSIDVGLKNLALWYGTIDATDGMRQTTLAWQVVDILELAGLDWPVIKKHTIPECCDVMDDYLLSHAFIVPADEDLDLILIEHQPTSTMGGGVPQIRMFGVSLTMRQTLVRLFPDAYMANFVSAKIKLKLLDDPNVGKEEKSRAKRKRIHKNATIDIVKSLADIPLDQGKKLDDLADCWLQARGWVKVRNDRRLVLLERERVKQEKACVREKKAAEKKAAAAERKRVREEKAAEKAAEKKRVQEEKKAAKKKKTAAVKKKKKTPAEKTRSKRKRSADVIQEAITGAIVQQRGTTRIRIGFDVDSSDSEQEGWSSDSDSA